MSKARDLALLAARIAAGLTEGEVESFRWQGTPGTGVYDVSLTLTEGGQRRYTVIERFEGSSDTPELST